jgi:hypothetical protein
MFYTFAEELDSTNFKIVDITTQGGGITESINPFDHLYDTSQSGLVSYWPMDETNGTTVEDVKDNNNGTASGTTIVDGKYRKARSFDGVDDYVDLGTSEVFNPSVLTFSAWVYIDTTDDGENWGRIIDLGGTVGADLRWLTDTDQFNSRVDLVSNGTKFPSSATISTGWHHVVLRVSDTSMQYYVDGAVSGSAINYTSDTITYDSTQGYIGGLGTVNNIKAKIDEVLIFNTALTQTQINTLYNTSRPVSRYSTLLSVSDIVVDPRLYSTNYKTGSDPASAFRPAVSTVSCFETTTDGYSNCTTGPSELSTGGMVALCGGTGCYDRARFEIGDAPYQYDTSQSGLVSYWPMDETSGTTVEDVKSNNNGTASGTTIVDGKYRKARSFNGSSDYIEVPDNTSLDVTGNLTIGAWIYPTNIAKGRQGIVFKHYNNEYEVIMEPNGKISFYHGDGTWEEINEPAGMVVTQNQWNHIAISRNTSDTKIRFYLNGDYIGDDIYTDTPLASTNVVTIGVRKGTSYYFQGLIDEVLIYNTALTQTQINTLYNTSRPVSNPSDTLYAIQISTDNFVSDIRYIDGSTNEPKNSVTLNDFRTKSQWESETFNILGLQEGTQYYLRIIALHGDFTQTEEGPEETTTTAVTSSSFDIDIAGTGGTTTETDPPFTVTFTGANSLLAGAGTVTADNLIWMDAETNGSGGFAIVQKGENGGLYSTTHSVQIDSVTGDLDSLGEGFGLQSYHVDYNTTSIGDISVMTNYSGSIANVGIVDTDWNKVYDANGPIIDGRMALYIKARAGTDKEGATDYNETITFVFVPRY